MRLRGSRRLEPCSGPPCFLYICVLQGCKRGDGEGWMQSWY
jgi:hypothetical protein